ncbi:hypothetical protein SGPA1_12097 [Streptomyces misionensis JCM 4497]
MDRRGRRGDPRGRRAADQRRRRPEPGGGLRQDRCPAAPRLHGLRLRGRRHHSVRRGRPDGAAQRLRPYQAGRRAGGAEHACGHGLRGTHGLAVRRGRRQFRPYDDQARKRQGHPRRGRRPARPAHLDRRPRRPARPPRTLRAGGHRSRRDLPRHQWRRDHLVRPQPGDLPAARRGSRAGPPHHQRRLRPPGPPAGLQRPRPRPLGGRRHRADPRLARRPARGVPDAAGGRAAVDPDIEVPSTRAGPAEPVTPVAGSAGPARRRLGLRTGRATDPVVTWPPGPTDARDVRPPLDAVHTGGSATLP